ncbi:MAG: cation:proton antiporter [Candidatus Dechloromonas phosphoritropha]
MPLHIRRLIPLVLLAAAWPVFAAGSGVIGENLLWLAIIILAARLFAPLAERVGFPAVLGELLLGVVLGNLGLLGFQYFATIARDPIIMFLAELGVIVLLLQIGLETRLGDLVRVGGRASLVGIVGITVPFVLGAFVAGPLLLKGMDFKAYLFLGATLAATSVGITGRVFRDLGKLKMPEAQIVLGAAVIDDVLGLVILAVVSSLVEAGTVSLAEVLLIIAKAVLFLGGSIAIGRAIAPRLLNWASRLDSSQSMLFSLVLVAGLFLAWLAHAVGLAPIIGGFAAGLLFEPVFLKHFETPKVVQEIEPLLPAGVDAEQISKIRAVLARHTSHQHEHMIEPIGYFFVPVFFVLTGMQVELTVLADPEVVMIALGITVAAVVGKLFAGFFVGKGKNPWLVGWGMVPRGEVGLIFAMAGKNLGVMSEAMFSVIVIMVILTTLLTPPILIVLLRRQET